MEIGVKEENKNYDDALLKQKKNKNGFCLKIWDEPL